MNKVQYVSKSSTMDFVPIHNHHYYEVIYYVSGSGTVRFDDTELTFTENSIVIIPPYVWHEETSDNNFCNYNFQFSDPTYRFAKPFVFTDNFRNDFLSILKIMYYEYTLNREESFSIVDCLYEVLYNYISINIKKEVKKNIYVEKAVHDILKNISNSDYNYEDIYKYIPYSKDYFRALFLAQIGYTPRQYLLKKRIEQAKKYLLVHSQGEMKIAEVALHCGFSDPYYFSKIFKADTNLSPKDWYNLNSKKK